MIGGRGVDVNGISINARGPLMLALNGISIIARGPWLFAMNGISMNGGDLLKRYRYTPEVLENLARKEIEDRVKLLLYHLRRLGIPENFLFAQDDLIELKNVPKVTRCIATLAKMVSRYD